ncbi:MAG: hydrogenase maturation nickel metallochaperone HypA [Cyanobacteriota bacterium]|nr:hydrogenase maturation nickel metallochaperone HypA [Cyanobacteriota bacterium]
MHELSLMQSLSDRVLEVASAQGAERVLTIRLRIGSLAGVDPEALRFAAQVVLAGTCAAGASLVIDEIQATCWCELCAADFAAIAGCCDCPRCGALSTRLLRGKELSLVSIELIP